MNTVEFYARDRAAWRQWLKDNHAHQTDVWLVYDKGMTRTMQWKDIVQEALCFGWIDSLARKRDDGRSMIYVSRRKPKGVWSKINKAHVEQMIADGLMMPAGLEAIELAKQNGAWNALDKSDNLELPARLTQLLQQNPEAKQHFEAFSVSSKRILLEWIYSAKRELTQNKRIDEAVSAAAHNHKANYWRAKQ